MIGKRGEIIKGKTIGFWVTIENDSENSRGYLILNKEDPNSPSSAAYDDWVENRESIEDFF